MSNGTQVFVDPTGRRRRRFTIASLPFSPVIQLVVVALALAVLQAVGVLRLPFTDAPPAEALVSVDGNAERIRVLEASIEPTGASGQPLPPTPSTTTTVGPAVPTPPIPSAPTTLATSPTTTPGRVSVIPPTSLPTSTVPTVTALPTGALVPTTTTVPATTTTAMPPAAIPPTTTTTTTTTIATPPTTTVTATTTLGPNLTPSHLAQEAARLARAVRRGETAASVGLVAAEADVICAAGSRYRADKWTELGCLELGL